MINKNWVKGLGADLVNTKKLYEKCKRRGFHNKVDASWVDWQGGDHFQDRCIDCGVYFDKESDHE